MNNVKLLDCTLRDGGRVIECAFPDSHIVDIATRLSDAQIEIVEVGFLRDPAKVEYKGDSTFFTRVSQINALLHQTSDTMFVAFIDFNLYDFSTLEPCTKDGITGLRVGFTKNDYLNSKEELMSALLRVKELGYKLFLQSVNTPGYSDSELLDIIDMANRVEPYAYAIVDTYGSMYEEDLLHYYDLVERNLNRNIAIDFHSHNNYQLSFSLAQTLVKHKDITRTLIIDATLDGMGKCAGNLNTELIVDYLNRKYYSTYDTDAIFDIIDEYLYLIKEKASWGYSIPSVLAGNVKAHPNNVIYLTEKCRLSTKDIKYILQRIDPDTRQRYDYDNIQRLYMEYNSNKVEDGNTIKELKTVFRNHEAIVLFPGPSIEEERVKIESFIEQEDCPIIMVNFFLPIGKSEKRFIFWGSARRYQRGNDMINEANCICTSNIRDIDERSYVVNYENLVERTDPNFENSTVMLLNLLSRLGIVKIHIAGLDGYVNPQRHFYEDNLNLGTHGTKDYESINKSVSAALDRFRKHAGSEDAVSFITKTIFEKQ